jgi:hypothetical protein
MIKQFLPFILLFFLALSLKTQSPESSTVRLPALKFDTTEAIQSRFTPPPGYVRVPVRPGSYAEWLRLLPLLPENSPVKDYRGRIRKTAEDTSIAAVVNLDISGHQLEQCMDIIIRLRAEFLYETKQGDKIVYLMPDRSKLKWSNWRQGLRPYQEGWSFPLRKTTAPDNSREALQDYLNCIFNYSDTQTYYFGLDSVNRAEVQIGDFIVKKGKKGHAVVIVDLARNQRGEWVGLIAQGDTPACQLHILNYRKNNPWVPLKFEENVLPLPIRKKMTWDGLRRFHTDDQ